MFDRLSRNGGKHEVLRDSRLARAWSGRKGVPHFLSDGCLIQWTTISTQKLAGDDPSTTSSSDDHHTHAIDLQTGNIRDLTPWQGVRCQHVMSSAKGSDEIWAVLNVRDRKLMDVWHINLRTGAATLEVENPCDVSWWVADDDLVVRGTRGYTLDGGFEIRVRSDSIKPWRTLLRTSPDEWLFPVCFDASGRWIVLLSSVGSDSVRLLAVDIESRREREIASMPGFDVEQMMIHPAIPLGNARLRKSLWMVVLQLIRRNAWLRQYYERLRAAGKPGKVAVIAAMRKLLVAV